MITFKGGAGNDTYVFGKGDGKDTIYDNDSYQKRQGYVYDYLKRRYVPRYITIQSDAGNDTLKFKEGITQADLILKADVNSNDLIVALKDGDKAFAELTDKIVLKIGLKQTIV